MDLFEKVKEVSELIEKANKSKEELMFLLTSQFVELPYKMKKIEADYEKHLNGKQNIIKVYYPVLEVPTGFAKKNETFCREFANCVRHEYTLKNEEGREVQIKEKVAFDKTLYKSDKGIIVLEDYITSESINYCISISSERYNFARKILYKDMLEQILEGDKTARLKEDYYSRTYQNAETKYEQFLKKLGAIGKITTLEELRESNQEEIQITPTIKAKLEICSNRRTGNIWLINPKFSVRLDNVKNLYILAEVQPYLNETIKLEKRKYEYFKLKEEEKWWKGITLEEAIKIIEEK